MIKTEQFYTTIGLEYTFIPKHKSCHKYIDKLKVLLRSKKPFNIYEDNGKCEICSPPHKNMYELLKFYDATKIAANQLKLRVWSKDQIGGGCHIHIGIPQKNLKIVDKLACIRKMYYDVIGRPYLNWIFNDPEDNLTSRSFLSKSKEEMTGRRIRRIRIDRSYSIFNQNQRQKPISFEFIKHILRDKYFNINSTSTSDFMSKTYALRFDDLIETMEMRFFSMPYNKRELMSIVKFAHAYSEYFFSNLNQNNRPHLNNSKPPSMIYDESMTNSRWEFNSYLVNNISDWKLKVNCKKYLNGFKDREFIIREFNNLLIELKLNPNDYKIFIKRNLDKRLKFDDKFLN